MTNPESNDERAEFEYLCSENGHNIERVITIGHINNDQYKDAGVQALWDWHTHRTQQHQEPREYLDDVSAIHALIGYVESLDVNTGIQQQYLDRLKSHYIPNVLAVLERRKPVRREPREVDAIEIKPCPYITFAPKENQGLSFIVKKYDDYFDYVGINKGKPSRCIRVSLQPIPTEVKQTGGDVELQLGLLAEDIMKMLADHIYNCQTPLRTKLCLLIRPYIVLTHAEEKSEGWRPIESAPYDKEVFVKLESGVFFRAILKSESSLNENEEPCDQWVAVDIHPPCWTDGACWENNAEEVSSDQPTHWQPTQSQPESRMTEAQPNLEEMVDFMMERIYRYGGDPRQLRSDLRDAITALSNAGYLNGNKISEEEAIDILYKEITTVRFELDLIHDREKCYRERLRFAYRALKEAGYLRGGA